MNEQTKPISFFSTDDLPMVAWGKGSYVYDRDGKKYIDGSCGPSVFALGHGNEEVNEAIKAQLDRIAHGYRYTFTSEPLEELQAILAERSGGGLKHSVLICDGSEAVESCLKIALQYQQAIGQTRRQRFIARQRSWHGNTLGALSVSGFAYRRAPFEGALIPASFVSAANAYRPPSGVHPEAIPAFCAAELEQEILRQGPEQICAFIFEPVVGAAGGAVPAPPGYAQAMREVCDRHGVLMIADEVMCGVGRSGAWRALEEDDVEPDLMAVAKGLGAGFIPIGAAIYHERLHGPIMEAFGEVLTGHTFAGHTTACAAAVAVQRIIERDRLIEKVAAESSWLIDALHSELGQHPHIGDIRGRGFFLGVEFVADRESKEPFEPEKQVFAQIRAQAMANGLICYPVGGNVDGKRGDIAILSPPYNATCGELEEIVGLFAKTCREVLT